jgi:uncharacterized membrane protein
MPPAYAPIPLPNRSSTSSLRAAHQPAYGAPVRWTLIVLSWLAFGVAGYLAFHSVSGTSVAGCGAGSANGCDIVLTSSWSKWLGIPVAVLGLACYATLASLSLLLGVRNENVNRWVTTTFVMLSVIAAGASVWFIGVQFLAIGAVCKFCLVTDACGIALGILAGAAAVRNLFASRGATRLRAEQPGLMALRGALPGGRRSPASVAHSSASQPSLAIAFGGAAPFLVMLIAGQVLFASKTHRVEQVTLDSAIKMDGATDSQSTADTTTATAHVAMRPSETGNEPPATAKPTEPETKNGDTGPRTADPLFASEPPAKNAARPDEVATAAKSDSAPANTEAANADPAPTKADSAPSNSTASSPPAEAAHQRQVKFLGGKLTLDVYKHPLIGSPDAPHIVIEMVSYDCLHCRKMHGMMKDVLARYGDQVALLVMPVPLDRGCNKLITDPTVSHPSACGTARMACGIAKLDPPSFAKFHEFLMTGKEKPPAMGKIVPKAYSLVNGEQLRTLTRGPEIKKQIEGYVDLYGQLQSQSRSGKAFGLPVQILGDKVVSGSIEKPEDIHKAWEENLGVKPN